VTRSEEALRKGQVTHMQAGKSSKGSTDGQQRGERQAGT
jgi:hypothetical protein